MPGSQTNDTLDVQRARSESGGPSLDLGYALALAWSAAAPDRGGEVLLFAGKKPDVDYVFGRGEARDDDEGPRILLGQQRPFGGLVTAPLEDPYLSRRQLLVGAHEDGVRVNNIGKRPTLVKGREVTRVVLKPGEVLEIGDRLLLVCVERPSEMAALREWEPKLSPRFGEPDRGGMVGESVAAWNLRDRTAFVAARAGHVLLRGESGTGKELVAGAIHQLSARSRRKLVARSAATFPSGIIDAELFGNVANYPNAGMPERAGIIGEADGGTLFLDEIGELPKDLQTHLLRVLDSGGEYHRLGDARVRKADLRVVAATNRAEQELKHDLAARMQLRIELPTLNDRVEDVPLIARQLLKRIARGDAAIHKRFFHDDEPRISIELARALVERRYSTHVRELESLLWASLSSSPAETLQLTQDVDRLMGRRDRPISAPPPVEITEATIREAMGRHAGVKDRVWKELGLQNRFVLHRLLKKYGIGGGDEGS
jgi:two-component system nitrogen regulation response regulator GlnG/two-component system response regulator HydG